MRAWWENLSDRERWLVAGGAAIALLLLMFQFVIKPVADWRQEADMRADNARRGYELVTNAAATGALEAADQQADNSIPLRQALTQTAAAASIELVRVGREADGQIEVQPAPVGGDKLFRWLGQLHDDYGVTIAFADVSRADDGMLNAQVLVFER